MVDLATAFLVVVLVFDFVVSLWNAYASGVTWTLVRNQPGHRFEKAAAIAGIGLAFVGMAYVLLIVLSFLALFLALIAVGDFLFLVSLDFLVFGALIIGFGVVVTAQSIAIAYRQRNFGAIAIASWNVIAEIWDVAIYAEGFRSAASAVSSGERNRVNLYAIVAVAVGVAFLITYVAYRQGVRRAEGAIADSPSQAAQEMAGPSGLTPSSHHIGLRRSVLLGIVVVIVVIAGIVVVVFRTPPTTVHVTEIDVWAPTDVCGLSANPVSYPGFDDSPSASDAFGLQLPNFNATPCTVHSVTTNTSGFGLSNVEVPVTVPGGGNGTLNLTVVLIGTAYSGPLNLVYT